MGEIRAEYDEDPILFIKFDMTDEFTLDQSGMLASLLGLAELFQEHGGTRGYMLLVDAKTHEVLGRLDRTQTVDQMKQLVAELLER